MARPVTIFTGQWADLDLEEMCRTAKDMGYDGLEIASWGQIDLQKAAEDPEYVKNLKGTLEKHYHSSRCAGLSAPTCRASVWAMCGTRVWTGSRPQNWRASRRKSGHGAYSS